MSQTDFSDVHAEISRSSLWRFALVVARAYSAAWASSWIGRGWRTAAANTSAWTAATRLRYVALVIAWAAAWQVVVLSILPAYVLSGLPRFWFAAVALGAAAVAMAAPALVRSWADSALAAGLARLNQKV